jgi:Raf kinase inhibitor-like YbhB/YbcL family protein
MVRKPGNQEHSMSLSISSSAFTDGSGIPAIHTCDSKNLSPPLSWSNLPPSTKSLALIVDDPDAPDPAAPQRTWVHWNLYNIPPLATGLPQGVSTQQLPPATREGLNDWERTGYGGPCPPIGRHRYFHKLYALDIVLPDLGKASKARLEDAIRGHIIEQAELVGTYQRGK